MLCPPHRQLAANCLHWHCLNSTHTCSDVKRGQTPKDEDKPEPWGRDQGQGQKDEAKIETKDRCSRPKPRRSLQEVDLTAASKRCGYKVRRHSPPPPLYRHCVFGWGPAEAHGSGERATTTTTEVKNITIKVTTTTSYSKSFIRDASYMRICDRAFCQNSHIAYFSAYNKFLKSHVRKLCCISKNSHIFAHMPHIFAYAIAFFMSDVVLKPLNIFGG